MNKAMLIGNIGQDPVIGTTQSGTRIANLSIATSESWKDKNTGEYKSNTEWHKVVVFDESLVGVIERFVRKGSKLFVEGALQTRKYTKNDGTEQYTTEIVLQRYKGKIELLDKREANRRSQSEDDHDGIPF